MLYEVLWNLVDKHGKNDAAVPTFENGVPTDGKYLAMKLVVDAMALYVVLFSLFYLAFCFSVFPYPFSFHRLFSIISKSRYFGNL